MKNDLLRNWNFLRLVHLVLGVISGIYGVSSGNYYFLILAILFIVQALLNQSCCCADCSAPTNKHKQLYKDVIKEYKPTKKHK